MANLMFKRGTQKSLNENYIVKNLSEDGCFYLTTDTNRLYVSQGANKAPVLLNQTVQIVNTTQDLPKSPPAIENDFYYVKGSNILAVFSNGQWVQINPNTNDTIQVIEEGSSFDKLSGDNNSLTYRLTLKQMKTDIDLGTSNLDDVGIDLTLNSADIAALVPEAAKVGLEVQDSSNNAVISTKGSGSDSTNKITLIPGHNVDSIEVNDGNITFNVVDTTYSQSVVVDGNIVKARLSGSNKSQEDIVFASGNSDIVVSGTANNKTITHAHKTYNTEGKSVVADNPMLSAKGELNVISGIELSNGHVSNITTQKLTLPEDVHITGVVGNSDWKRTLQDNVQGSFDIDFSSEAGELKTDLEEYIAGELAKTNTAMTYKGVIDSWDHLDNIMRNQTVEIGDVYMFSAPSYDNIFARQAKVGDLVVAYVESPEHQEGGVIINPSDNAYWALIPSGDELAVDTQFLGDVTIDTSNKKVSYVLKSKIGNTGETVAAGSETLEIGVGKDLVLSDTSGVALIDHKTFTTDSESGDEPSRLNFTAISGIETDNGHITKINYSKFTPMTYAIDGEDNKIKFLNDAGSVLNAIQVSGENGVEATVATDKLVVRHEGPQDTETTVNATNAETVLVPEGNLKLISKVEYDVNGHITNVEQQSLTLPKDTTFELKMAADAEGANITSSTLTPHLVFTGSNGHKSSIKINTAGSIEAVGTSNSLAINMVWGEF